MRKQSHIGLNLDQLDVKNRRVITQFIPVLKRVNAESLAVRDLTNSELESEAARMRSLAKQGTALDELLPRAYALVREASRRVTGLYPYNVQILGAILLHYGYVAEMKTGEGKTLVAAMPAFLNALTGQGVHIVTVNDYLARVGAQDIGRIFRFLGLSVGLIQKEDEKNKRRMSYACDVVYATNSELGFDYLRDNRAMSNDEKVQRGLNFAIIDEADSVLIDEARTPLILSGVSGDTAELYQKCAVAAAQLVCGESAGRVTNLEAFSGYQKNDNYDYLIDEKDKLIYLTDRGVKRIENLFEIKDYAADKHQSLRRHMLLALRAQALLKKDRDYIVQNDKIVLVDEFTGRLMPGKEYNNGLNQAVEAKEGVTIRTDTKILASITYQNFFNKYTCKCGMTGTAMSAADEFGDIYGFKCAAVPTNKPVIRKDAHDVVFLTKKTKYAAVVGEIRRAHETGRPILVGTVNVSDSEFISERLIRAGIKHDVLNAKNDAFEAEIVSHAGEVGAVTIATNMAGRGTDIKLSDEARKLGGLYVIGTERHEARRIDDQLRGRSGRQGDPGLSRFFLSLEDDVTRLFGAERMIVMLKGLGANEKAPIKHKSLDKMISDAQRKIESINFETRKTLMDFDVVDNEQRELIYAQRQAILSGCNPSRILGEFAFKTAERIVCETFKTDKGLADQSAFLEKWRDVFPIDIRLSRGFNKSVALARQAGHKQMRDHVAVFKYPWEIYDMERHVFLRVIDWNWLKHLNRLEKIKQSAMFASYEQKDITVAYRELAYKAFGEMLDDIEYETIKLLFRTRPYVDYTPIQKENADAVN